MATLFVTCVSDHKPYGVMAREPDYSPEITSTGQYTGRITHRKSGATLRFHPLKKRWLHITDPSWT